MSAETRHAGLTADERSEIRSTVLETRELIEDDLFRQLQRYGIYEDEQVDLDQLGHLDTAGIEIRKTVDAALDREFEATEGDYQRSVQNFVREATKTELNRLVALKAIEVRGLVSETLTERPEYGHRSEMLRALDEVAGELTGQPDGGMGVALSLAFDELSDEIGVIFEESELTAIDVDFAVRDSVIDALNDLDQTIWKSDEAMGWVYQYFGEKERDEIDERIDEENYKVQDTDVATKTQLFTPRYIVEWMVDNSLGRLWLEMHGDTTNINDEEKCFYLAPLEDSLIDRPQKDVRDIKVLDPACGSGHMLFYAFDVLYEMYLEQGDVPEKYIPREILNKNLYGIDIDPGAAQIAALALYVKAKSEEPDVEIEGINIVSADAVLVNGEKKDEVLSRTDSDLERRVLEEIWTSFKHIREYGSLVRIEERIEEIIEEELEEIQETGQARFANEGLMTQSSVMSYSGGEETWEQLKERLLGQVSELAEEALEQQDPIEEIFVDEVEKSVRLLDLFVGNYDVVVSNPPYLDSGKIDESLKQFIKENYRGTRDLYTAFIERCIELAAENDYVTMVTPENFMYISSYRQLRKNLVPNIQIIEGAHLSGHSFPPKDRPFTIPFVLRKCEPGDFTSTRFYRMTHEQEKYSSIDKKIIGLREITQANRQEVGHDDVYIINQNDLLEIEGYPFVYWFGDRILKIIKSATNLEQIAESQSGIKTGDNDLFLRKYWEPKDIEIDNRFKPIIRSEDKSPYFDKISWLVDWKDEGDYIKRHAEEYNHQYFFGNEDRFGDKSLAFIDMSKEFTVREVPANDLCSKQLYLLYFDDIDLDYLNGWLNSSLIKFIIDGFNPSLHFTQTDVMRLPYVSIENSRGNIKQLVETAKSRISYKYSLIESAAQFDPRILENSFEYVPQYILQKELVEADLLLIKDFIDSIIFDECDIPDRTIVQIRDKFSGGFKDYPHILNSGGINSDRIPYLNQLDQKRLETHEYQNLTDEIKSKGGGDLREISRTFEISPYTVANIRHEHNLYTDDEREEAAGRLLSYYLGCIMGRWNLEGCTPDFNGILVFDDQFEDNVEARIRECIELTFDDVYGSESKIEDMLGRDTLEWLRKRFFRYHHTKEYRRRGQRIPIYWQLESDDGAFSCFVYYHAMDNETLPKLRGQYIDQKIDTLLNRLDAIDAELDMSDGDRARDLRSEREEVQADIDDIREFRERVDRLIDEGFTPDFEAGIWENIQKVDEHDLLAVPLDKL